MKALTWSCAAVASCLLLATAWARGTSPGADDRDDGRAAPPPGVGAAAGTRSSGTTIQNLSPTDQLIFFHQPEGIELVPLPWIKALKSIKTNRPFLKFPERFGLIEDPTDKDHLPIGITASASRGGDLFGRMVGVNCAACHVGAVTRGPAQFPLFGAPNLFDLNAFYQELFASLGVMLQDEPTRLQFLKDLASQGDAGFAILTQQLLAAAAVASQLDGASLKDAAQLFQARLIEVVKGAVAKAEAESRQAGPPTDPASIAALKKAVMAQVGGLYEKDALGLVALVLLGDIPDDPVAAAIKASTDPLLVGVLQELEVGLSLLRARVRFIASLKVLHEAQRPLPGPGRIDAFDGIRDLVFPQTDGIAADSPVSYPELWLVNQTYWLHWDGNTNSLIERNIGQALGQGAPFERVGQGHYHSLVQPANIALLEQTVRKLAPPDWPVPLFGPIDADRAARGKAIYQDRCVECHRPAPRDGRAILDAIHAAQAWAALPAGRRPTQPPPLPELLEKVIPVKEIGTDPARAMNFATNVGRLKPRYTGGTDFAAALGEAAWQFSLTSYKDNDLPVSQWLTFDWPHELVRWRVTRGYIARPLVSAWATAPYLHNASVPTLYHLLLPAKDRPKLFPVGQREYDPVRLGYVIDPAKIPLAQVPLLFEINTTASGNSNAGHEGHAYGTDLNDDQRYDLLEFLKTL